jgi:hypothetical protein
MPSELHQNLVLLLREHPEFTVELAMRAGVPIPGTILAIEETSCELDDPLDPCNPVRADLAFILRTTVGTFGLIIEVQLGNDGQKEWTIVLYRAALRRRLMAPAWAVVFSPSAAARRGLLRRMFAVEPELRPHVIMPDLLPLIADQHQVLVDYPAAILGVAMHPCGVNIVGCATLAVRALIQLAPRDHVRYIQLISTSVGDDIMQQVREQLPLEDREQLSAWERRGSTFQRGLREGRAEGRVEGRAEGRVEGRAEGRVEGRAEGRVEGRVEGGAAALHMALQDVLTARGLLLDAPTQARIAAVTDPDELRRLITRAATLTVVAELFGG